MFASSARQSAAPWRAARTRSSPSVKTTRCGLPVETGTAVKPPGSSRGAPTSASPPRRSAARRARARAAHLRRWRSTAPHSARRFRTSPARTRPRCGSRTGRRRAASGHRPPRFPDGDRTVPWRAAATAARPRPGRAGRAGRNRFPDRAAWRSACGLQHNPAEKGAGGCLTAVQPGDSTGVPVSRTCPDCHNTYDDDVLHCPEDGVSLTDGIADDLIGHAVGSYRVVKLLGKGGMGSVYMAEHPAIGSKVAIKFLHPQYSHDEKIVDRFFNEARAVNVIGHDNILKILDLDVTDDNRHYFVMEFLHGRPLQSLLKGGGPVPLQVSGPIVLQVCDALGAAHEAGIVHRDLKPDNVYLIALKGKKNFVKVVDFGIAK